MHGQLIFEKDPKVIQGERDNAFQCFSINSIGTIWYTYAKKKWTLFIGLHWIIDQNVNPKTTNLLDKENIGKKSSWAWVREKFIKSVIHLRKIYYIDCGDGFMGIYICQNLSNCIF